MSVVLFGLAGVLGLLAIRQEFVLRDYQRAILDVLWAGLLLAVGLLI